MILSLAGLSRFAVHGVLWRVLIASAAARKLHRFVHLVVLRAQVADLLVSAALRFTAIGQLHGPGTSLLGWGVNEGAFHIGY